MSFSAIVTGLALLMSVNSYRAAHHLPILTMSPETCTLAVERLHDMQTQWSHAGFYKRLTDEKLSGGHWAENLARFGGTPDLVVSEWDASPTHKINLLDTSRDGCIASDGFYSVLEIHQTTL